MTPSSRQPRGREVAPACLIPLALSTVVGLLLAGCGVTAGGRPGIPNHSVSAPSTSTAGSAAPGSMVDQAVAPVILRNPASGTLDASLYITFEQGVQDSQLMAEVSLGFTSGGQPVQFAGQERIICDGTDLPVHNRAADFQVIRAPASELIGTTIRCDYIADHTIASVYLLISQPPAITSPLAGARVPRGAQTAVTYRDDPATATLLGIVALAPGSASPKALARMNTPAASQASVDTSGFSPGPGSLVLTATLTPRITGDGARFKSLTARGSATAQVNVIWT